MSLFCDHTFILDCQGEAYACSTCGLVSDDIVYGNEENMLTQSVYQIKDRYFEKLREEITLYVSNFFMLEYDITHELTMLYKNYVRVIWSERNRPNLNNLAVVMCYYIIFMNNSSSLISMWDIAAAASNYNKRAIYKIHKKMYLYNNAAKISCMVQRDMIKLRSITSNLCRTLQLDKYFNSIYNVVRVFYNDYNFTSPLKAIAAAAIYVYIKNHNIKITLKEICFKSCVSSSCIKRLKRQSRTAVTTVTTTTTGC